MIGKWTNWHISITTDQWTQQNANVNAQQCIKWDTCWYSPLRSAASVWVPVWSLKWAELWGSLSPPGWAEAPRQLLGLQLTEWPAGEPCWQANPRDTCWWNTPPQPLSSLERRGVTEETMSRWSAWRAQKLLNKRDTEFDRRRASACLFSICPRVGWIILRHAQRERERGRVRERVFSVCSTVVHYCVCIPPTELSCRVLEAASSTGQTTLNQILCISIFTDKNQRKDQSKRLTHKNPSAT